MMIMSSYQYPLTLCRLWAGIWLLPAKNYHTNLTCIVEKSVLSFMLSLSFSLYTPFSQLFAAKSSLDEAVMEDDLVSSSAASSRRESYCSVEGDGKWRRRSSTSDALRFRQRMRQTSSHESHEEIPNSEENTTDPTRFKYRTEPAITITAASGSSQESMDTVKRPANFYKEILSSMEETRSDKGPVTDPSDVREGSKITTGTDTHSEETATDVDSLIQNETYDL